jgi:hypothetical protein
VFDTYFARWCALDEGAEGFVCRHVELFLVRYQKLSAVLCGNCELGILLGECCGGEVDAAGRAWRGVQCGGLGKSSNY